MCVLVKIKFPIILSFQQCADLENKITNLEAGHKTYVSELTQTIEENAQRHKSTVEELKAAHKTELDEVLEDVKKQYENKVLSITCVWAE